MKQVRETKAGKSISAWIILNRKGELIAKVHAHYSNSEIVTVNCWQTDSADKKSRVSAKTDNKLYYQEAKAHGYGYDKFTSAIAGFWIDGHKIANHCESAPMNKSKNCGYRLANWDESTKSYKSCYKSAGLKYLEDIGYRVIQAI